MKLCVPNIYIKKKKKKMVSLLDLNLTHESKPCYWQDVKIPSTGPHQLYPAVQQHGEEPAATAGDAAAWHWGQQGSRAQV